MNIIERQDCDCGYPIEDPKHYLFDCPHYAEERRIFQEIDVAFTHDVKTFLFGDATKILDKTQNSLKRYVNISKAQKDSESAV